RLGWQGWRQIAGRDSVHRFRIVSRNHFDRIPRTTIKECSVRSLARALLTSNTEIRIDFDSSKRRMIFVRNPEHAGFDGAVLNASRRARATRAAIGSDRENAWPLLARRFTIADGHGPILFYDIEHALLLR